MKRWIGLFIVVIALSACSFASAGRCSSGSCSTGSCGTSQRGPVDVQVTRGRFKTVIANGYGTSYQRYSYRTYKRRGFRARRYR